MLESHQLHYHGGGIPNGAAQSSQDPFEFRPLKVEPDVLCVSQAEELALLRVRVQQLEREMARLAAENHHLKDLLVKEIPGLLSAMRQTLAPAPSAPPAPAAPPPPPSGHGLSPGHQPDLLCSLSSSPSSCSSSLAHADRGYGLLSWAEHGPGVTAAAAGPESIPSISELLRCRHQELDGSAGSAGSDGNGGNGLELLESLSSRAGGLADVMKFELSDELEDELAPFLRELGPRGPTATPCGASPCQQAEMRMRGRPPGCGQLGDHCHVEQEEVFPGSGVFCDAGLYGEPIRAPRQQRWSGTF
ncbi:uncharacterized protein LOC134074670 [Sardina pilchardus]|uniref:uncharacterized protein LOC134074670 n=1 Tax=Sardina pilchardus TaxID=27697 RepID=UPI002E15D9CC